MTRVRRKEADGLRTVMTLNEPRRCDCGRAGDKAMVDINEPMRVRQI